ncbi:MAG: lysozyme [Proteobacteria bacterium]|nr:lysozyme [Pseudomonadota bacterium]
MGDPINLLPDDAGQHRVLGQAGAHLIKSFEGCAKARPDGRFEAYPDPGTGGKPWTIGWGTTGPDVVKGLIWTQGDCDRRFLLDAQHFVNQVAALVGNAPTSQNQFDAMVSFQYNTGHLAGSTLLAKHLAGDFKGAAAEFGKWTHAGGKVLPGLVKRRAAEAALYGQG